jgi:ubiquinone/menaquinone biosynthesis C-methylase UbiE
LAGRERLRLLARVMHASTSGLFDRLAIGGPLRCLDAGCGGGDVSLELARRVAPSGSVLGIDMDAAKIAIARDEAAARAAANVTFRTARVGEAEFPGEFDVVYARFLLTHIPDPQPIVTMFHRCLKPGGLLVLEDIDFSGYFVWPESRAFRRYVELYCLAARRNGCDPDIGPRLPRYLQQAGCDAVDLAVVQPMGVTGEVKLVNPVTMENIADSVLAQNLTTQEEVDGIVQALYAFAADPHSVAGLPRVVQAWGRAREA